MKKVYIDTAFTCTINNMVMKKLYDFFIANKYIIVKDPKNSDIAIIDSCVFIPANSKKNNERINDLINNFKSKKIIVVGCAKSDKRLINKFKNVIFLGVKETKDIEKFIKHTIPLEKVKNRKDSGYINISPKQKHEKLTMFKSINVIISRGCTGRCSYCNTKKAIGNPQSRPIEEIINEIKFTLVSPKQTISLQTDDAAGYGIDIGTGLFVLLARIMEEFAGSKIVITHVSPRFFLDCFENFEKVFATKKISAISLTIQSSSVRIIKLMNRNYDPREVVTRIKILKKLSPKTNFSTHLLFCFPSETKKEFLDTVKLISFFDKVIINIYKKNPGTPASKLTDISGKELKWRKDYLERVIKKSKKDIILATE